MHWVFITGERGGRELLCLETGTRVIEGGQGGTSWANGTRNVDYIEHGANVSFNKVVMAMSRSGALIE